MLRHRTVDLTAHVINLVLRQQTDYSTCWVADGAPITGTRAQMKLAGHAHAALEDEELLGNEVIRCLDLVVHVRTAAERAIVEQRDCRLNAFPTVDTAEVCCSSREATSNPANAEHLNFKSPRLSGTSCASSSSPARTAGLLPVSSRWTETRTTAGSVLSPASEDTSLTRGSSAQLTCIDCCCDSEESAERLRNFFSIKPKLREHHCRLRCKYRQRHDSNFRCPSFAPVEDIAIGARSSDQSRQVPAAEIGHDVENDETHYTTSNINCKPTITSPVADDVHALQSDTTAERRCAKRNNNQRNIRVSPALAKAKTRPTNRTEPERHLHAADNAPGGIKLRAVRPTLALLDEASTFPDRQAVDRRQEKSARRRGLKKDPHIARYTALPVLSHMVLFLLLFRLFEAQATHALPIRWEISAYGDCDVTCGRGVQSRTVVCRKKPEGLDVRESPQQPGIIMPDIMCPAPKPQTRRNCSQVACPPTWQPSPWSKCSHTCGRGTQQRKLRCMQKLGTGEIVHVSPDYCSRKTPTITRQCSLKMCPAKYGVQQWSQCDKTCGKAYRTRVIACLRVMDGSLKPQVVPTRNCRHLRPPATRKPCKHRKCPPTISTTDEVFIQTKKETKVRLQVGSSAYVFPRTTVIVRCRVERFKKGHIFWLYNEQRIESDDNRRSKLVDGSLRIIRAEPGDSGTYSCIAGLARADIRLTITENTTRDAHELGPPQSPKLSAGFPEYDGVDLPFPVEPYPERRNQVFVSPVMSYHSPVRAHPNEISFAEERPVLMVNVRTSLEPDSTGFSQNPIELYPADADTLLPADEEDYLTEVPADGDDPQMVINQLHQLVQVPPHYDPSEFDGDFTDFDELTEVNEQHELRPLENSPLLVNLQQEELDVGHRAPSIIRQPTVPPFQLGEIVNVYVGGSLIVGGAERITFLCEAEGAPEPVITWYRDETLLPDNSRQYILDDGSLRLFKPVFADAGVYKCVASNSHGNDTLTTTLGVTQKPHILSTTDSYQDFESEAVEVTIGSSIRCRLGSKVKIRCPTEAYPDPYVVWRKDSGGLRGNARILSDNSIEINPTTPADQGLFSCEASNPSGSDYQASSLVLIDPPHISDNLNVAPDIDGMNGLPELLLTAKSAEDHRVKANSSVMMGCPVTGFPEPHIRWTFDGMPLADLGNRLDYQLMQNDKILQIPNAGRETEGTYACHATNEGGSLTTSLRLGLIVYTYAYGELTECSATCGGSGTRHKQLRCLEDGGREVDEWYCIGVKKPTPALQPCNRVDCPPRFIASPWGSCSVSCGNGTRSREIPCMVLMSDGSSREVAAEECSADTRPVAAEACYDGRCPRWRAGPWKCTRRCLNRGVALKVRKIFCVSGDGTKLERRKACRGQLRPQRKSVCKSLRCQPVWIASPWSVCSKSCGQRGFRTRILSCVYRGRRRQVAGSQCSNLQRPPVTLPCNRVDCRLGPRTPPVKLPEPCEDLWQSCVKIRRYRLCGMYRQNCCKTCRS